MPAAPDYSVRLAEGEEDLRAAQALRYEVFVRELGGSGEMVDHAAGLERDRFDAICDHLLLCDGGTVVGVYRLLRGEVARAKSGFYCEAEYDLGPLIATGRRLLELGRSCLHVDHRGGTGMMQLWQGLAGYVAAHDIEILFGVASFHGTDIDALAEPLSLLHQAHLAPPELRVRSRRFQSMDLIPSGQLDRRRAMLATPALIKAYLRLGGHVGEGAFIDHDFNTVDVCLIMDTARLNARQARIYGGSDRS